MTDAPLPPPPPPEPPGAAQATALPTPASEREPGDVRAAPPPHVAAPAYSAPQVGQLTVAWQIMAALSWAAAFFALAGVWKASEEIGIATWWLGPRADPQPLLVRMVPFAITVVCALAAVYNVRRFPLVSIAGSLAIAVVAAFDLSNSVGLALAQFAIAAALLLVSISSFAGRYVARPAAPTAQAAIVPPPVTADAGSSD